MYALLLSFLSCIFAQAPARQYYTIFSNHRVASFTSTGDSIVILKATNRPGNQDAPIRYKVLVSERHGQYSWLYVQQPGPAVNRIGLAVKNFGLVVLYTSTDKGRLYLLDERASRFATLEACKAATASFDPTKKFFTTWYSSDSFAVFSKWPALKTADSATVSAVVGDWRKAYHDAAPLVSNTPAADIYGAGTGQDLLNKALIDHHLNPSATLGELDAAVGHRLDLLVLPKRPTAAPPVH